MHTSAWALRVDARACACPFLQLRFLPDGIVIDFQRASCNLSLCRHHSPCLFTATFMLFARLHLSLPYHLYLSIASHFLFSTLPNVSDALSQGLTGEGQAGAGAPCRLAALSFAAIIAA